MASNFDFLKKIDKELYEVIIEAENLFRNTYFSQCVIQIRIFGEKMTKKISSNPSPTATFDELLNNLKDNIKNDREKEFIDDLFYIKKQGNACAHGEDITGDIALDTLKRAFEVAINYSYFKTKDENTDKLLFDETLFVTGKKDNKLINEYLKRANTQKEELSKEEILNRKQGEFLSQVEKQEDEENAISDKYSVKNAKQYSSKNKNKKELSPKKQKIKEKVKIAKKNLKENVNKTSKKQTSKNKKKTSKKQEKSNYEIILFIIFTILSLFILSKFIF